MVEWVGGSTLQQGGAPRGGDALPEWVDAIAGGATATPDAEFDFSCMI